MKEILMILIEFTRLLIGAILGLFLLGTIGLMAVVLLLIKKFK
jgi:hypothetical protein